jgi:hypothetical protein
MLMANQFVPSGGYMIAANQKFVGVMQDDGRFCVYHGKNPVVRALPLGCAPSTAQRPAKFHMEMRADGNLCFARGAAPTAQSAQTANADTYACLPGQPQHSSDYIAVLTDAGKLELHAGRPGAPASAYWSMSVRSGPAPVGGPGTTTPLVTLNLIAPQPKPPALGAPQVAAPSLVAYVVDANGKRDEKGPQATCPGQCTLRAELGARVEIASSSPVRGWTGGACTRNQSREPTRKCIVTLVNPGNAPTVVGVVLQ